jgi:hypothetical protein
MMKALVFLILGIFPALTQAAVLNGEDDSTAASSVGTPRSITRDATGGGSAGLVSGAAGRLSTFANKSCTFTDSSNSSAATKHLGRVDGSGNFIEKPVGTTSWVNKGNITKTGAISGFSISTTGVKAPDTYQSCSGVLCGSVSTGNTAGPLCAWD